MKSELTKFAQVAGIMLALTFTFSCSSSDDDGGGSVKTVKIGNQVWMAKNLNNNVSGSKCYEDKSANCDKYGRLYSWDMAKTACPSGWHLPSDAEWDVLVNYVGGSSTAGTKLKAKSGWDNNGNGTDDFSFSALPGGKFNGSFGGWWTAKEEDLIFTSAAIYRYMGSSGAYVSSAGIDKRALYSVRCIQD